MTKKDVLIKVATIWSGVVGAGARLGKAIPSIASFAAKRPKLLSAGLSSVGGAAVGAGLGALKNPGTDEFGQTQSRLKGALLGAGIGAGSGALLGAGKLGKGFGLGAATNISKNPNTLARLQALKKPFHPIKAITTAGLLAGSSLGASALTSQVAKKQSQQVSQGNE